MADLFSYASPPVSRSRSRAWYAIVMLTCAALPLLIVAAINYVNPGSDILFQRNTNIRISYLAEHSDKGEVVLIGSSRANALDIQARLSPSGYTFPMMGGWLDSYLYYFQLLIDNDIAPEVLLLGFGEAATQEMPGYALSMLSAGEETWIDTAQRLLSIPGSEKLKRFYARLKKLNSSLLNPETGREYCKQCEAFYDKKTDAELQQALDIQTVDILTKNQRIRSRHKIDQLTADETLENSIEKLHAIVRLAEEHDVKLFIYADPVYRPVYLSEEHDNWFAFKQRLAKITGFLDFGTHNEEFNSPRGFYDPIHYNEHLGNRLLDDIGKAMNGETDDLELGTWLTSENADAYLEQQRATHEQLRHAAE